MDIDLRVLDLLSSKICHDLISPVSAINNGVELIEDIGASVEAEAMGLIGNSAAQAARRLRLFRIAYGRAGSEQNLPVRDVRQVCQQFFIAHKIEMKWDETLDLQQFADHQGALKVLINAVVMAEEILAYGGVITLQRLTEDDKIACRLEVVGRNAAMSQAFQEALDAVTPIEELTPRTIQPYMTGQYATRFGVKVSAELPETDHLHIVLEAVPPTPPTYDKHHE